MDIERSLKKIPLADFEAYKAAGQSVAAYFLGLKTERSGSIAPHSGTMGPYASATGPYAKVQGPYADTTISRGAGLPYGGGSPAHENEWEHRTVAAFASVIAEAKFCHRKLGMQEALGTVVPAEPARTKHLTRLFHEAEALVDYRWSEIESVALRLMADSKQQGVE